MKGFPLLLLILMLTGCTKTVTTAQLDAKAREQNGNTFPNRTYYVGSADGYDYFVVRGFGGSARYRVLESEEAVTNRFSITKDETRWRGYGITGILVTNGQLVGPDVDVRVIVSNAPSVIPK